MDSVRTDRRLKLHWWVNWLLWAVALTALLYLVGLTVWLGVTALRFPYQLDYGEGVLLHFVEEWAQGRPIYKAVGAYPYITCNYAPLPILLALALTPLFGSTYATGRLWALLAAMAVAAIVIAWVRLACSDSRSSVPLRGGPGAGSGAASEGYYRKGMCWLPAVTAAMVLAGSPYIYHWAPLFRVDLVGLALTLGGLFAVWRAAPAPAPRGLSTFRARPLGPENPGNGLAVAASRPQQEQWRRTQVLLALAIILFVAGLYAKQSFVFAPLAAIVYLFLLADRRQAVGLALGMALLGGGLFLLINALTGGGFWDGLVVSNVNPFLWPEFWQQIGGFFGAFPVLVLLAGWYLVDKYFLEPSRLGRSLPLFAHVSLLDLYLPIALASIALAGKAGAWENYFLEALVALTLCAGLGLARLIQSTTPALRLLAPLLVLAQIGLMWHTPGTAASYLELSRESNQEIAAVLASSDGHIISEDMGLLVTNDKVLDYYSFQYSQLARAGRWDQAWELEQLRNGLFSLVILEEGTRLDVDRYQRFTREFLSELDRGYALSQVIGKYYLYRPDPLQHERRAEFGDGDPRLALVGWSLQAPAELAPGDVLQVTVVWQAQQALAQDYVAFAHLVDEVGQGWAGDDHQPYYGLYPTSAWGASEMVRDTFHLAIPPDVPSGLYSVQIGWYDPVSYERLAVDGGGEYRVAVLPINWQSAGHESPVGPQAAPDALPGTGVAARFGPSINLESAVWQADRDSIQVTLRWSAGDYLEADYTVFVHLVPQGAMVPVLAQGDAPPLEGRWPTSLWLPGFVLEEHRVIQVPTDLPPGTYDLLVGLYDPRTGKRQPLPDGSEAVRLPGVDIP